MTNWKKKLFPHSEKLQQKWWHRLAKVAFTLFILFIGVIGFIVFSNSDRVIIENLHWTFENSPRTFDDLDRTIQDMRNSGASESLISSIQEIKFGELHGEIFPLNNGYILNSIVYPPYGEHAIEKILLVCKVIFYDSLLILFSTILFYAVYYWGVVYIIYGREKSK